MTCAVRFLSRNVQTTCFLKNASALKHWMHRLVGCPDSANTRGVIGALADSYQEDHGISCSQWRDGG